MNVYYVKFEIAERRMYWFDFNFIVTSDNKGPMDDQFIATLCPELHPQYENLDCKPVDPLKLTLPQAIN